MPRSTTVFPGSLVDGLLSDLAAEQRAAPQLAGPLELEDLRWNLDRIASHSSADTYVAAAASAAVDRAAALQALRCCSDDTLETLLECSADWHCLTDGVWTAAEPTSGAAEGGRAAAFKQRHEESKRPFETWRQIAYLVQLLSDSAYSALPVHQRVHQLEALLLKELVVSAGGDLPARAGWEPFTNASSVYNQGRIDNGTWALPDCTPHPGVAVTEEASCTALPAEAGSGQPQMFRLRRSVCVNARAGAREMDVQALAFFRDAQEALTCMLQCTGNGRAQRAQILLGQLAPLMRASEISAENDRK